MARKGQRRPGRRQNARGESRLERSLLAGSRVTASAQTVAVPEDIRRRTPRFDILQRPPLNFQQQIHWFRETAAITQFTPNDLLNVESNVVMTVAQFPAYSAILALFDQYCIYEVVLDLWLTGMSTSTSLPSAVQIATAIDLDNVTNIGLTGLQQFASYNLTTVTNETTVQRFVKPCVAPYVTRAGGVTAGSGITRAWLDSGYSDVLHYGFRIISLPTVLTANTLRVNIGLTAIIGARNHI